MTTDYAREYRTARERIRAFLADGQWHSWRQLRAVGGVRYGARLLELRRLGHRVETLKLSEGGKTYRLNGRMDPPEKKVKVFLTAEQARSISDWVLLDGAVEAVRDALASFECNEGKL